MSRSEEENNLLSRPITTHKPLVAIVAASDLDRVSP